MIRRLYKILFPYFYKNEQPANRSHDIISSSILLLYNIIITLF